MIPIVREFYSLQDTIANLLANLEDNARGINTTDNEYSWTWEYDGVIYVAAISLIYNGSTWELSNVRFNNITVRKLLDSFAKGGLAIGETGETALSGFTATSIVGALNELKSGISVNEWLAIQESQSVIYNIAKQYGSKDTYIHVSSGLIDDDVVIADTVTIGQVGETSLDTYYNKQSILGCFNQLGNNLRSTCIVWLDNEQDIVASTETKILFDTVVEDQLDSWDLVNNRYKCSEGGFLYLVTVGLHIQIQTAATEIILKIEDTNSNLYAERYKLCGATGVYYMTLTGLFPLSTEVDDGVQIQAVLTTDKDSMINDSEETNLSVHRLY